MRHCRFKDFTLSRVFCFAALTFMLLVNKVHSTNSTTVNSFPTSSTSSTVSSSSSTAAVTNVPSSSTAAVTDVPSPSTGSSISQDVTTTTNTPGSSITPEVTPTSEPSSSVSLEVRTTNKPGTTTAPTTPPTTQIWNKVIGKWFGEQISFIVLVVAVALCLIFLLALIITCCRYYRLKKKTKFPKDLIINNDSAWINSNDDLLMWERNLRATEVNSAPPARPANDKRA